MSLEFLNYSSDDSQFVVDNKYERYHQYLVENRKAFPLEAYEFATADWHYYPTDHRCPKDSWVESLEILECHEANDQKLRFVEIKVRLLGAYHDGKIELYYKKVRNYELSFLPDTSHIRLKWHGDWIIDEVRLSEERLVVHDIRFWLEGRLDYRVRKHFLQMVAAY